MRHDVLLSLLYHTIGDVAAYLEANASTESYGFLDGGETLEICSPLLEKCRQSDDWQALEQRYQQVGGTIYCPDDDDWVVEVA